MCKHGQVVPRVVQNVAAEVLQTKDGLPDPSSPLGKSMPSSSIDKANKEVSAQLALVDDDGKKRSCIVFMIATLEQKA